MSEVNNVQVVIGGRNQGKTHNFYLLGIEDCKTGLPAKSYMPEDYYRGYSTEYTRQQNVSRGFN